MEKSRGRTLARDAAKKLLKLFGKSGIHWTRGDFAKTKSGRATAIDSPHAARWCLLGGTSKLNLPPGSTWALRHALAAKLKVSPGLCTGLAFFNDHSSWPVVREFLESVAGGR